MDGKSSVGNPVNPPAQYLFKIFNFALKDFLIQQHRNNRYTSYKPDSTTVGRRKVQVILIIFIII